MAGVPFVFEDNREILQGLDTARRARQQPGRPLPPLPHEVVGGATRVVRLAGMLSPDDLRDDALYREALEDITVEVCKYGDLLEVVIPRPGDPAISGGVGKVFLKYGCLNDSIRCRTMLDGRWFAGRRVVHGYYPDDRFAAGDYGYDG
ncbi:unnamed protein product [Alopecurus aequalis]